MIIVNNTHYYSINNKVYNIVPDQDSWQFQSSKRLTYSQRLYWEYKYVKSVGGQAFFYTFSYNNKSLPHFDYDIEVFDEQSNKYVVEHRSVPCFNYDHIRLLTNGIISKELRRKYGSQMRYFVACERGEGKGFRGKGKNPHYHVIFFIFPLSDKIRKLSDVSYKRISPIQFCHLCKCVWQYNSTPNKYDHLVADYKSARFGHCQPGDDLGLITDFDALSYVSKYVVKDTQQTYDDIGVKYYYLQYFTKLGPTYHALYSYYLYLKQDGVFVDKYDFMYYCGIDKYFEWRSLSHKRSVSWVEFLQVSFPDLFKSFFAEFNEFFKNKYLPELVEQSYRDYVNKYGSKVRCSKLLGSYGLEFVRDVSTNPHFVIDSPDEVKTQPISLYYYRKLYMDVVTCPHTGNPLYVLNEAGLNLKCLLLSDNIAKLKRNVYESLDGIASNLSNPYILDSILSDGLVPSQLKSLLVNPNLSDIIDRFAVYRFIYQYRSYDRFSSPPAISLGFSIENFGVDYRNFLSSNFYTCDYSDLFLLTYCQISRDRSFVSFANHPEFIDYISYFTLIEKFFNIYQKYVSEIKKFKFEQSTELRQKLNANKYASLLC